MVAAIGLMVLDHGKNPLTELRAALSVLTYPLHLIADLPADIGNWTRNSLASHEQLETENRELRAANLRLQSRLQKLVALEAENMRLRDLLGSSLQVGEEVVIAELSAVDLDPYKQQVVIAKGASAGVFKGQPVLDAHGVAGQVIHVNPFNATVLLITDASHALPVQVLRNGLRTIAVGTGRSNQLELPYLPNNSDIREGDQLVTSGLGGSFPPGYPVAEITQVQRDPGRPFAHIVAQPQAQLDRHREVMLVWTIDPIEPMTPLETDETEDGQTSNGQASQEDGE